MLPIYRREIREKLGAFAVLLASVKRNKGVSRLWKKR